MISTLALGLSGGAAFADHWRGGGYHGGYARGGVTVRPTYRGSYGYGGGYYRGGWGYRRPIYVGAPVIREHYYNYYRPPGLIVENYGPMDGYGWVRGHWAWSGYEWMWQPGHYQPVY